MFPMHVDHRPLAAAPTFIGWLVAIAAAIRDACLPFVERHSEFDDSKLPRERHAMLRAFDTTSIHLALRRAHHERPRRRYDHLGASVAFLEAVLRLEGALLSRRQRARTEHSNHRLWLRVRRL